jgi:hypothetical protein
MAFVTKAFKIDNIGPINEVTEYIHNRAEKIRNSFSPSLLKATGTHTKEDWGKAPEASDEELEIVDTSRHLYGQSPVPMPRSDKFHASRREVSQRVREAVRLKQGDPPLEVPETIEGKVAYVPGERHVQMSRDGFTPVSMPKNQPGEALVEMKGVKVQYGEKAVLGDWKEEHNGVERSGLWWTISRGQRWGVFGPNGRLPPSGSCNRRLTTTQAQGKPH